jgi:hypothetical protein
MQAGDVYVVFGPDEQCCDDILQAIGLAAAH